MEKIMALTSLNNAGSAEANLTLTPNELTNATVEIDAEIQAKHFQVSSLYANERTVHFVQYCDFCAIPMLSNWPASSVYL
jgi:hypothetical protein